MADAPPRLDPTAGAQPGYAPISWMAVASLGVAGFSVLLLAVIALVAFLRKQPLIEVELLAFPALAVVLAFIARRQIANSEGTRTGERYANAGWWIGAIAGLGYAAYLLGLEQTIRNDAQREFQTFANLVAESDPANPSDKKFYEAALRTIAPGLRGQVRGASDAAGIERTFRDEIGRFRQLDMVRIALRNPGQVRFTNYGVRDWQQAPTRISCTLTCKMLTPEGEHQLVVPMQAAVDKGIRQWEVLTSSTGFVQNRSLTRYGWMVEELEESGKYFANYFLSTLTLPGRQSIAYDGYVRDGGTPEKATQELTFAALLPSVVGGWGMYTPSSAEYLKALENGLLTGPNNAPLSPADLTIFRFCWENNRISPTSLASIESGADYNSVLRFLEQGAELKHPIQLMVPSSGSVGGPARGRLILQTRDPELTKELKAAREAQGGMTPKPPADLSARKTPWRVLRVESDLKAIPIRQPGQGNSGG